MFPLQALIKRKKEMKELVLSIAGALLLTACADQQSREPQLDTAAIGFATSVTRSATGPVSGFVAGDSFDVWAQMVMTDAGDSPLTGTPVTVFSEEPVTTADGTVWSYVNTKYWEVANYAFAAIFPAEVDGASVAFDTSGNPVFSIANYNATANYDLMTASQTASYRGTASPVQLQFDHIMSNIVFEARTAPALEQHGVSMTITSFKLTGFPVTASYDSSRLPAWRVDIPQNERYNSTEEIPLGNSEDYVTVADLIVFPQSLGSEGSSLRYEVNYRSSEGDTYTRSGRINAISGSLARWQEGVRYRYTMELGGDYILFGVPEVEEWSETSGGGSWTVE